jgi:hypothetical protein
MEALSPHNIIQEGLAVVSRVLVSWGREGESVRDLLAKVCSSLRRSVRLLRQLLYSSNRYHR